MAVPVPRVHVLCEDDSIIGTMFYVMDYVEGRVYTDRLLPGCTPAQRGPSISGRGFSDVEVTALGIPSEAQFLKSYRQRTGRADIPDWTFFVVFSLFRAAAILAGVYRRSVDGQGVDARMTEAKQAYQDIAQRAWALAAE